MAAQQLLTVMTARRAQEPTFSLGGMAPLALNPQGQLVVTLNPEYKGRVSIPDNLMVSDRTRNGSSDSGSSLRSLVVFCDA